MILYYASLLLTCSICFIHILAWISIASIVSVTEAAAVYKEGVVKLGKSTAMHGSNLTISSILSWALYITLTKLSKELINFDLLLLLGSTWWSHRLLLEIAGRYTEDNVSCTAVNSDCLWQSMTPKLIS